MFPEKPKRQKQQPKRLFFILLLLLPSILVFQNIELGLLGDSIAVTVMLCAAIYLVYQVVEWLIRLGHK